jgi:UDP-N-acetylmuramate--alanine ligase
VPPRDFDLGTTRAIHIVGIGGAGMSAIATVLARMGHVVSGSDLRETPRTERLRLLGADVSIGHGSRNVPERLDAVVCSTAIPRANPEVTAAEARGVPVLRRAEALRAIVATKRSIAVAGSHGKTTTSSMLTLCLRAAGWHPSFLIGGDLNEVGTNAAYDDGEWLVVEADESDGTFLELVPDAAIVTNIEPDHLDHYGDFHSLVAAFAEFVRSVNGPCVVAADDPLARELTTYADVVTFGQADDATYRLAGYAGARAGSRFELVKSGTTLGPIELPVPGLHNARNAAAAAALALEIGVPFDAIRAALGSFGGVARRFQFRGEVQGVTLIDDYAHIPGEVAAMTSAAREGDWGRVVVIFQPHRYTRTASLWREFADAFTGADVLVLTDVYAAGEVPQPGISGRLLLRAVLDAHPDLPVAYLPRRADVVEHALTLTRPGDVLLTLGAGDITNVIDEWLAESDGPAGAIVGAVES